MENTVGRTNGELYVERILSIVFKRRLVEIKFHTFLRCAIISHFFVHKIGMEIKEKN